jgi:hypothetical protein
MDLRIFTEPQQGASYDTLLAAARATQDAGFSALFRSDHYLKMGDASGLPGPTDAGVERVSLQVLHLDDVDHISLLGRDVRGGL